MLEMSSDHAGINQELGRLQVHVYRCLAEMHDPRDVRDFLQHLGRESTVWMRRYFERNPEK